MRQVYKSFTPFLLLLITFLAISTGCSVRLIRELSDPSLMTRSDTTRKNIKIHMKDGSLYVADSLIVFDDSDTLEAYGSYYSPYRNLINCNITSSGLYNGFPFYVPLTDIALLETNSIKGLKGKMAAIALVAVPSIIISTYCIINPKACFGSCPTFYSYDGKDTTLCAEGFSSSILRAYEKEDIDMLYQAKVIDNGFRLRMKNEALETHFVRYANIIAVPRTADERVFATETGEFLKTSDIFSPVSCIAPEGDCLEAVRSLDQVERYSASDNDNLATREFIELRFDSIPDGELGLIIGCRQTLMTTFLFYQSLAYLGKSAGYFASRIESGDHSLQKKVNRVWDILGGIEILIPDQDGGWKKISEIQEMGPIAVDVHLIKLPETGTKDIRIKLRLTKGLWRIDYLALGKINQTVEPFVIEPSAVVSVTDLNSDKTMQRKATGDPLVTLPGDIYDFYYDLPDNSTDYEIFLKSRGYYLEWMRESWLKEENLKKAAMFFVFPRQFMKTAAVDFKIVEKSMETSFWNSKYVKKN